MTEDEKKFRAMMVGEAFTLGILVAYDIAREAKENDYKLPRYDPPESLKELYYMMKDLDYSPAVVKYLMKNFDIKTLIKRLDEERTDNDL